MPSNAVNLAGFSTNISSNNLLVGGGTSTGTANQPLQVTGGAYVSGNLGVGVTNPTRKLEIGGETAQFPTSFFINRTSHATSIRAGLGLGGDWIVATDVNGTGVRDFGLYSGVLGITPFRIDTAGNLILNQVGAGSSTGTASQPLQVTGGAYISGNLGIGNTNPGAKLDVTGDVRLSAADAEIEFNTGGARLKGRTNALSIHTGGGLDSDASERVRINTTGVGIGTTNPQALLQVGAATSQSVFVDTSGRLLVGTSSTSINSRLDQKIAVVSTGAGNYGGISLSSYNGTTPGNYPIVDLQRSRGTTDGSMTSVVSGDQLGAYTFRGSDGTNFVNAAIIFGEVDGAVGVNSMPGRLVFSTTAAGASSPTERMRISQAGFLSVGNVTSFTDRHVIQHPSQTQGNQNLEISNSFKSFVSSGSYGNAAATNININSNTTTSRSLNANGTINASGADYAEYMVKTGDFDIAKGAICGVTSDGFLTLDYSDAVSFVVKSTNPSYVGGDTWGSEDAVGPKPDADDTDALAQWEADLEAARQKVDRIAFAGQVPVNVTGATPGQYIVPVEAADGGIEGIAKNETDLTLAEYMRAVGKVIAIEDDGRARIIVKVA